MVQAMKAKDLAAILLQNPEFEVEGAIAIESLGIVDYHTASVKSHDVGYSDRKIKLLLFDEND